MIDSAALLLIHSGALALHLGEALLVGFGGALLVALWLTKTLRPRAVGRPYQVARLSGGEQRGGTCQGSCDQEGGKQEYLLNIYFLSIL